MISGVSPLMDRAGWKTLQAHYTKVRELSLRKLFADDPETRPTNDSRGRRDLLRLLEEPHHR